MSINFEVQQGEKVIVIHDSRPQGVAASAETARVLQEKRTDMAFLGNFPETGKPQRFFEKTLPSLELGGFGKVIILAIALNREDIRGAVDKILDLDEELKERGGKVLFLDHHPPVSAAEEEIRAEIADIPGNPFHFVERARFCNLGDFESKVSMVGAAADLDNDVQVKKDYPEIKREAEGLDTAVKYNLKVYRLILDLLRNEEENPEIIAHAVCKNLEDFWGEQILPEKRILLERELQLSAEQLISSYDANVFVKEQEIKLLKLIENKFGRVVSAVCIDKAREKLIAEDFNWFCSLLERNGESFEILPYVRLGDTIVVIVPPTLRETLFKSLQKTLEEVKEKTGVSVPYAIAVQKGLAIDPRKRDAITIVKLYEDTESPTARDRITDTDTEISGVKTRGGRENNITLYLDKDSGKTVPLVAELTKKLGGEILRNVNQEDLELLFRSYTDVLANAEETVSEIIDVAKRVSQGNAAVRETVIYDALFREARKIFEDACIVLIRGDPRNELKHIAERFKGLNKYQIFLRAFLRRTHNSELEQVPDNSLTFAELKDMQKHFDELTGNEETTGSLKEICSLYLAPPCFEHYRISRGFEGYNKNLGYRYMDLLQNYYGRNGQNGKKKLIELGFGSGANKTARLEEDWYRENIDDIGFALKLHFSVGDIIRQFIDFEAFSNCLDSNLSGEYKEYIIQFLENYFWVDFERSLQSPVGNGYRFLEKRKFSLQEDREILHEVIDAVKEVVSHIPDYRYYFGYDDQCWLDYEKSLRVIKRLTDVTTADNPSALAIREFQQIVRRHPEIIKAPSKEDIVRGLDVHPERCFFKEFLFVEKIADKEIDVFLDVRASQFYEGDRWGDYISLCFNKLREEGIIMTDGFRKPSSTKIDTRQIPRIYQQIKDKGGRLFIVKGRDPHSTHADLDDDKIPLSLIITKNNQDITAGDLGQFSLEETEIEEYIT